LGPPEPRGAAPGVPELSGPVAVSAAADALVITVAGPRLDEENSGTIRNAVNSSRLGNIILDLSRVTYMSSVGTGALVSARKASAQRRGRLILAGLQPAVLEVMKVMGLSSVFETAPDAELAARALKKP
jgi:anti-anti-sigma factor